MVNPVQGAWVSTPFGKPGSSWCGGRHGGIDLAHAIGKPVYAAWGGTVTASTWGSSFGIQVVVKQDSLAAAPGARWAVYAHLSARVVSAGQRVKTGQQVGRVGSTGASSGPHLHYEVQRGSQWRCGAGISPQPWLTAQPDGTVNPGMAIYAITFFQRGGTIYEADLLAGTYWAIPNPQTLSDRRMVLTKMGVPWIDWSPGKDVDNPSAFGRRV